MNDKKTKLFATPIMQGKITGVSNSQLISDVQDIMDQDSMGWSWSKENYYNGYTSYASVTDLQFRTPEFSKLHDHIMQKVKIFARGLKWEMRGLKLEITSFWINFMQEGTHHALHHHPHSVISGTYFVSIPKGSVALKLEDPRVPIMMYAPLLRETAKAEQQNTFFIKPSSGNYILFESWLRHEVPVHRVKQPRVSVSFNVDLIS